MATTSTQTSFLMPRVIGYCLIVDNLHEEFTKKVNKRISEGWQPQGACFLWGCMFAQTMVKYETHGAGMYTIKPLEFESQSSLRMIAVTRFGDYTVALRVYDSGDMRYTWTFCFNDHFDCVDYECESFADGMLKAQRHWEETMRECLIEVTPCTQ